jgi:hypothetical protein
MRCTQPTDEHHRPTPATWAESKERTATARPQGAGFARCERASLPAGARIDPLVLSRPWFGLRSARDCFAGRATNRFATGRRIPSASRATPHQPPDGGLRLRARRTAQRPNRHYARQGEHCVMTV